MIVYRLSMQKYANDLSGRGAELAGGRWNSKGVAMIYTCESIALCTLEIAVHTPLGIIPNDYILTSLKLPDDIKIKEIKSSKLPTDWRLFPHPASTQFIGNIFIEENKYLAFKVSSAIVPDEYNILINPFHRDFPKIKIIKQFKFDFDTRLFI